MVITERQQDGSYVIRGRTEQQRFTLPRWPMNGITLRRLAPVGVPGKWLDEVVNAAREELEAIANGERSR